MLKFQDIQDRVLQDQDWYNHTLDHFQTNLNGRRCLVNICAGGSQDAASWAALTLISEPHAALFGLLHHHQLRFVQQALQLLSARMLRAHALACISSPTPLSWHLGATGRIQCWHDSGSSRLDWREYISTLKIKREGKTVSKKSGHCQATMLDQHNKAPEAKLFTSHFKSLFLYCSQFHS